MVNRELVNYVFERMAAIWGIARYNSQFGGADTLAEAKREWAEFISSYTMAEIENALHNCKMGVIAGNDLYRYPSVSIVLQEAITSRRNTPEIENKTALTEEQKEKNKVFIANLIKEVGL